MLPTIRKTGQGCCLQCGGERKVRVRRTTTEREFHFHVRVRAASAVGWANAIRELSSSSSSSSCRERFFFFLGERDAREAGGIYACAGWSRSQESVLENSRCRKVSIDLLLLPELGKAVRGGRISSGRFQHHLRSHLASSH